jgi:Rhs element Vgr protein
MSQLVETTIDIDGVRIHQFSSLSLTQSIAAHHSFKLVCPAEAVDGRSGALLNRSRNLVGTAITIKVNAVYEASCLLFGGLVTQVEAVRSCGHAGDVIISGYSPTILLDNGPHCTSWERKSLRFIMQNVLGHFPANLLPRVVSPLYNETISYVVQYKETGWQLLNRLAAAYGEWLLYDGQQLVIGRPACAHSQEALHLTYGAQLSRFAMSMQLKPARFQMTAYDYLNHEVYNGSPNNITAMAGLNELGVQVLEKSAQVYSVQPRQWNNRFVRNQKQLNDVVAREAAMHSSNVVRFTGASDVPGIRPGSAVAVKGANVFDKHTEYYGDFMVIAAHHYWDGMGNYSNEFEAVPASVKLPPVLPVPEPRCETQSALVVDNNDAQGLGRVRVKFHWMSGEERSPWLRVATPHAGDGKGVYMMPEIGEEVVVAFEGDSASRPYVIGAMYHGKAKAGFGTSGNDIKAIQTRSGNKILMNDQEGSIQVEDKDGNVVKLDGAGNIRCSSKSTLVLECGEASITLKKDGTIQITGNSIEVTATNKAAVKSGGACFTANGQSNEAGVKGSRSVISGTRETRITSNANTTIDAGATVKVEGALITLN